MSLGFAAFSATLNISSSATVTPDSGNFNIELSASSSTPGEQHDIPIKITGNATAADVIVLGTSVSGLKANFTEPGSSVAYTLYAHNIGEYDAYLTSINFENISGTTSNKKCTKTDSTATDSLVADACAAINLSVVVNKKNTYTSTTSISNHLLEKSQDISYDSIQIVIEYDSLGARADGTFEVEFGDIVLNYSTVNSAKKMISFSIDVYGYEAEEGMTFLDWINSPYNDGTWDDSYTFCDNKGNYFDNLEQVIIEDGGLYTFGINCVQ